MKKIVSVVVALISSLAFFALAAFAAGPEFTVENGVLTAYSGSGGNVEIPFEIERIAPGVFPAGSVSGVTVLNANCVLDDGSIGSGIEIRGSDGSTAQRYAEVFGNPFSLTGSPSVTLSISYVYADGTTAAPSYSESLPYYRYYSVDSPVINGYAADIPVVKGNAGDVDVAIVVTYTKIADPIPEGWKIDGNRIRYYDPSRSAYVSSETRNIDGVDRYFDADGYLSLSGGTVSIDGETYYLLNGVICTGAMRIGDGIYYFNQSGQMVRSAEINGNTYDAEGRMTASDQFLSISGVTYFLDGNSLYSGFLMIGEDIYCFGSDYDMKVGVEFDGYTFDSSGHLSHADTEKLEYKYEETKTYNKFEQKPSVEVFLKGLKLTEGVHYTVDYEDNTSPGTGKIIVNGRGPVSGTKELTFEIVGKETFTLTVRYQNARGYEMHEPYTAELNAGDPYNVASPEIEGYKPNTATVSGTMPAGDLSVVVTYTSEKESESSTESETETEKVTETEIETEPESETEKQEPTEVKKRTTYSYNYKLFFTVAGIATAVVAAIVILIVIFGKKRRNPPTPPDDDGETPPDGPADGGEGPADDPRETKARLTVPEDKSKTIKFDLNEIALVDFDENEKSSDFVDVVDFDNLPASDTPTPPPADVPRAPKRYRFRTK